jgi:hypothetical protein
MKPTGSTESKEAWMYADTICRGFDETSSPELVDAVGELCEVLRSSPCCLSSEQILPLLDEVQLRLDHCRLGGNQGRSCDPLHRAMAAVEQACRT